MQGHERTEVEDKGREGRKEKKGKGDNKKMKKEGASETLLIYCVRYIKSRPTD